MNLKQKFISNWQNIYPFNQTTHYYVVATSGGVDSVALCFLFHQIGIPFAIAHCNFNLRGEESQRDEKFVEDLAAKLNITFLKNSFNTAEIALETKESIQVTARNLRYKWFTEIQQKIAEENKYQAVYIVTAHHLNDNIETVLHHLIRGTGIAGLTGMDVVDKKRKIIRPLLEFTRQEIEEFISQEKINFVEDSSNATTKYTRNFLRQELIPIINSKFPNWEQNMKQNIVRFNETEHLYNIALQKELKRFIFYKDDVLKIPINLLLKHEAKHTIIWEILQPFGLQSAQIIEVVKLLQANNAAQIILQDAKLIKDRLWLLVVKTSQENTSPQLIEFGENKFEFTLGKIKLQSITKLDEKTLKNSNLNEVFIPKRLLQFPLILRPLRVGDYFYPLGMEKKKKLSRFLIDLKLSSLQKEKIWVIESNKKIVWIINYRLDNRFKVVNLNEPLIHINFLVKQKEAAK